MNCDGNDMKTDRQKDAVENLRWLAASDPKRARIAFQALARNGDDNLRDLLESASRPGEGRLRQMIATVFKTDSGAVTLEPWLRRWLTTESDEFTKTAIESALASRSPASFTRSVHRNSVTQVVESYRFVADRLCHRIRNAMTLPNAQIKQLEHLIRDVNDPELKKELTEILAGFQTGFVRISRNVEFDTGDDYLAWQSIPLFTWLDSMEKEFSARYDVAKLVVTCEPIVRRATVRATRFFLETIFGNLWSNAIQAAEPPYRFELQCALDTERATLNVLVLDNGPGFAEAHLDTAFQQVFSTKSQSRGRGLLEVADAVVRLQGAVELTRFGPSEYRVRIRLPVESP